MFATIKLYNVKNIDSFFSVVEKCKGDVELITDSGMYNLRSKLSQVVAAAKVFSNGTIKEIALCFSNADDCTKMLNYCVSGC